MHVGKTINNNFKQENENGKGNMFERNFFSSIFLIYSVLMNHHTDIIKEDRTGGDENNFLVV